MATVAATGCYKCGRVGHWSKDCPSSSGVGEGGVSSGGRPASNGGGESGAGFRAGRAGSGGRGGTFQSTFGRGGKYTPGAGRGQGTGGRFGSRMAEGSGVNTDEQPPVEKVVLKRPKVDPELLLSSEGIAYIKEKFPKKVVIKGPGHEVGDLKRLLEAYSQWHCRIFPSLTFSEFIVKVEKVGATKRVRMALRDMRDGIDNDDSPAGADADRSDVDRNAAPSQTAGGANGETDTVSLDGSDHRGGPDEDDIFQDVPEDVFEEAFQRATGEATAQPAQAPPPSPPTPPLAGAGGGGGLSAEQKARIEANRQLAIERIRARTAAAAELRFCTQAEEREGEEGTPTQKDPQEMAKEGGVGGGEEGSGTADEAGRQRDAVAGPKRVLKIPGTGVTTPPLGAGKDGEGAEGGGLLDSLHPNRATSDALQTMLRAESEGGETESWRARPCGSAADGVVGGRRSADVAAPHTSAGWQGSGGGGGGYARRGGKVDEVAAPPKLVERMRIPGLRQSGNEGGDVEEGNDEVAAGEHQADSRGAGGIVEEGGGVEEVSGRGGKRRKVAIDDDNW